MNPDRRPPPGSFRTASPYPFCPGCGHGPILDRLNEALVRLALEPHRVVLVSDIGCSGLSDQYFATNAFHGLHGRCLSYASGIKLARPDLEVVALMGDGGAGIGGAHLLNAARRNIGVTTLVFNNFNFGMTGGQHSVTTPPGAVTATTPLGNLERPLDLCTTAGANGASYVWRGTSFDADLGERIAEAITTPGFALLDIWEFCTAYYVPANRLTRKALSATLAELGFGTGVLYRREAPEYAVAYREVHAALRGRPVLGPRPLATRFRSPLDRRFRWAVCGSAGGKVRSAVRLAAQAAIVSGLWAAQRDDYPVTVQTGHSTSELILAPEPFEYTGVTEADALLVLSTEGLHKAIPYSEAMGPRGRVFALAGQAAGLRGPVEVVDPVRAGVRANRQSMALVAVAAAARALELFPGEALEEAARSGPAEYLEGNLAAIRAGLDLAEAGLERREPTAESR